MARGQRQQQPAVQIERRRDGQLPVWLHSTPATAAVPEGPENADRAARIEELCAAAYRAAVPGIPVGWERVVSACEAYDVNFDPNSLTGAERDLVLAAWQAAV